MTTRPAEEPVEVLFVGGMPRSGSTLFELLLGQLPDHCDVGELFYLWASGPRSDHKCACGKPFSDCDFWTRVGEHAFGGWTEVDVDEILDLQSRVDTTSRLPLLWVGRLVPAHRRRVDRYLEQTKRLYRAVSAVSGSAVVVDSTKRPSTAALLAQDPGIALRIAHVVRDPRGVLNAWSREVPLPEGAGPRNYLKRRKMRQILRRWVTVNLMTEALGLRGVPIARFRYEDFVRDPADAMSRVLELSGRAPGPAGLGFITDEGIAMGVSHAATGGRVRFQSGPMALRLDEKWRRELPRWKQRVTKLVCGALMRRYGYH